jgi:putative membrane protein
MNNKTNCYSTHSKSSRIIAALGVALLTGLCVGSSRAQDTSTATASSATTASTDQSTLSHGDRRFLMKASWASANEVALSQLAVDHASSADVKSFAQEMVMAHTKLNNDLQALATQKNVDTSKAVEKGQKDDVDSLAAKSGADFDKEYVKMMVKGHEGAVSLFTKESTDGKDADVTALAAKYLPIVTDHLQHAKMIGQSVAM